MTKMLIDRSVVGQALEALAPWMDSDHTVQHAAYHALRAALAQQAEPSPFGCVTVRRLSLRHENHADQYQFYPAGQSPYLDNVDECHTVYTAPPKLVPLTDEEILDAVGWERAEMYMKLTPNFPVDEAKKETLKNARAVERALEEKNRGR